MLQVLWLLLALTSLSLAQSPDHHASVNENGDQVMGFSHQTTTHHFVLLPDGGTISVTANDAADQQSIAQIRAHLTHITHMFSEGDFTAPMLIHSQTPPGVPTMKELKHDISYTEQDTPQGGKVRIASSDPKAIAAIHEFLRFQIKDHQTGHSLTITKQ